jgi:hypothetical protein
VYPGRSEPTFRFRDNVTRGRKKIFTGCRQSDDPRRAVEQPHAKLALELLDRCRQRLLDDVQTSGSPCEVEFLCSGDEVSKVA